MCTSRCAKPAHARLNQLCKAGPCTGRHRTKGSKCPKELNLRQRKGHSQAGELGQGACSKPGVRDRASDAVEAQVQRSQRRQRAGATPARWQRPAQRVGRQVQTRERRKGACSCPRRRQRPPQAVAGKAQAAERCEVLQRCRQRALQLPRARAAAQVAAGRKGAGVIAGTSTACRDAELRFCLRT